MRQRAQKVGGCVMSAVLLLAWGCGQAGGPASQGPTSEAKVTGKVTIKGKPATRGKVTFEPVNASPLSGAQRVADIQKDGAYEINATIGENTVIVAGTGDPAAEGSYNTKTFQVKAEGPNTLDLDLPLNP